MTKAGFFSYPRQAVVIGSYEIKIKIDEPAFTAAEEGS
jgi:hypothetical protein